MKTTSLRARALACALLAGTACCGLIARPAAAQAPTFRNLDSNGVDLVHGDFLTGFSEGSIGSGDGELALLRMLGATGSAGTRGPSQWDHILLFVDAEGASVDFGSRKDSFPGAESRGATLSGGPGSYQYRSSDGTVMAFSDTTGHNVIGGSSNFCGGSIQQATCILLPTTITSPDGKVVTLDYEYWRQCLSNAHWGGPPSCAYTPRLARVANSYGYEIRFAYASPAGDGGSANAPADFHQRTGATFHNSQAGSAALASVAYEPLPGGVTRIVDAGGREWFVTANLANASSYYGIRRPGAPSDTTGVTLTGNEVTSVVNEGVTTHYSRSAPGTIATMTVTRAVPGGTSPVTEIVSDLTIGRPTSVTDPLSQTTTSFQYDLSGRLKRTTAPEGNYVEHTYDDRGNVTRTEAVPKGGSGPVVVTSALYSETCANPVTCNRPVSTTDARGSVTEYEYDPDHGGVTIVRSPAPTPGAVRPETRNYYTIVNGEHKLTRTSQCRTASSCEGTADEVKSDFAYDSNGNLYRAATGNGTGSLVAETTMSFDALGNLRTVDGPLPGAEDSSHLRYNAARQVIGSVSPDPDGAGALKPRAVRNTYDPSTGLLTRVEQGNVAGPSDSDWAAFGPAQAVETIYDSNARPIVSKLVAGSTVYALAQTKYDALGRVDCVARRMDIAGFASSLPDACTLTAPAGSEGPDRITKSIYDPAGRLTQVRTALGTADEANEAATTYTPNGQVGTVTDAENNKTTYEYDGHDRLLATRYPLQAKGANASAPTSGPTADFEQSTYEMLAGGARTSGIVTAFRNRAGETTAFAYDALGRMILKDLPGGEPDSTFAYDLLGGLTSATRNGVTVAFTWDALGRQLTQTIPIPLIANPVFASEYDLAGRRTRLTWPVDASGPTAYHVDYDYLVTGEVAAIREKGATSGVGVLAVYGYDDLGRRTSLARGNGAVTSYAYDAASRLSQMVHDFAGTAHDLTATFAYNPAGQIVGATRSNDLYAWTGHGSGSTASSADGRNRLDSLGGAAVVHDARGNITSDGTTSYTYSSENLLTSFGASGAIEYDPLLRLYKNYSTYYVHDGAGAGQLIGEYHNGNVSARRIPGPGMDEPLADVTKTGARFWYHADERGSAIALSNDAGASDRIVRYDEYGRRAGGASRFGYTGQVHLMGDIYDYKNRNYNARLGRFLQPDPIGYGAGMNLYAYVNGDPVNFTDPMGLEEDDIEDIIVTGTRFSNPGPSFSVMRSMEGNAATGGQVGNLYFAGPAPGPYSGPSFCPGARMGRPNFFNPSGRIVSGKVGTFDVALADLDSIAEANDLSPLGDRGAAQVLLGQTAASWIPFPVGKGWWVTKNYVSGDISTSSYGLTFRINPRQNKINIDIPAGLRLPDGQTLRLNETCHYKAP